MKFLSSSSSPLAKYLLADATPTENSFAEKLRYRTKIERYKDDENLKRINLHASVQAQRWQDRYNKRWRHVRFFFNVYMNTPAKSKQRMQRCPISLENALKEHFMQPKVTYSQLENVFSIVFGLNTAHEDVQRALNKLIFAYDVHGCGQIDYRPISCAFRILEKPYESGRERLMDWFHSFAIVDEKQHSGKSAAHLHPDDIHMAMGIVSEGLRDEINLKKHIFALREISSGGALKKAMLLAYMESNPDFVKLIESQAWDKLTEDQRSSYLQAKYQKSVRMVEDAENAYRMEKAMQFWKTVEPRNRLERWKEYTKYRRLMKFGHQHYLDTVLRKALWYLQKAKLRTQWLKTNLQRGKIHYQKKLCKLAFSFLYHYWYSFRQIELRAIDRSRKVYLRNFKSNFWKILKIFLQMCRKRNQRNERVIQCNLKTFDKKAITRVFSSWRDDVQRTIDVRDAELRQQKIQLQFQEFAIADREIELMEQEEQRVRKILDHEKAMQEKRQREYMQEQTHEVYRLRKMKRQEAKRSEMKQAKLAAERLASDLFWKDVEEKAAVESIEKTKQWLSTEEGMLEVKRRAEYLYEEEPSTLVQKLEMDPTPFNVLDCEWQVKVEKLGAVAKAYWYNSYSYEKVMCDDLTLKDCNIIVCAHITQENVNAMKENLRLKVKEHDEIKLRERSAIQIQMMFRCYRDRKYVRSLLKAVFTKRINPENGQAVYYNSQTRETLDHPPYFMGSQESMISVESTTWIRLVDDYRRTYYLNQITEETSWDAPPHHIMCSTCKIDFVTRRNNATGRRYCISCYGEGLYMEDFGLSPTFSKIPVQAAKCIICQINFATVVCHDCSDDALCHSCFTGLHKTEKLARHTNFYYLTTELT